MDPGAEYPAGSPLVKREILGVKEVPTGWDQFGVRKPVMLEVEWIMFTYPITGSCPLQPGREFDSSMRVNLSQLRVLFMNQ